MQFRELEYVIAIAKHQGIGRAANELYVTQPTLSKFVQNLHESLGQPLFKKIGNKFLLTYAGERYVDVAKSILESKKRLDCELSEIIQDEIGELRIAFRMCGGINILPKVVSLFWKQYPRMKISIREDSTSNIEKNLINGEVDLAFVTSPIQHPSIFYEPLSTEEILLVMSINHPLAGSGIIRKGYRYPWFDLRLASQEKFILQQPSQKTRQIADHLFRDYGIKPNTILTVNNIEISVQLASEGYGLAFAGEVPLAQIKTRKDLVLFSIGTPKTESTFTVAYKNDVILSKYMKSFISLVKTVLKKIE